ncbi:MAG: hypothetical protein LIP10_15805 [Clostridiales bacterium]|nr:hypothetical protein [Clostridiales bacterium]
MSKNKKHADANAKEADIRKIEGFCVVTSLIVTALCFLFASGILQSNWMLGFIQMFGALMNLSVLLIFVLRKKTVPGVLFLLILIAQVFSVVYFLV